MRLKDISKDCTSWSAFRKILSGLTNKQKGDLFEELVKAYLQLSPEYKTKLSDVWLYQEVPYLIRTELNLPSKDMGIDLIAKTMEGEYWAIQCKYRENKDVVLHWETEISTFAGSILFSNKISFGLLCSTTARPNRILTKQDKIGLCSLDIWEDLGEEFFGWVHNQQSNKPISLSPRKPRLHQMEAIKDAHDYFSKGKRRGKLIMPCATGKSLTAYWISQDLGAKKVLIAVPSLFLIRQSRKDWLRESLANGENPRSICICSDETAGNEDCVSTQTMDIGAPCLTNPNDIARWLNVKHDGLLLVFTTYQSGVALSEAAKMAGFKFDLGIMDEAHKTVGDKNKLFSHLLFDGNIDIEHRLFMTATERRLRGEKSDRVLTMDDANVYGEAFHVLTVAKALKCDPPILSPYKIKVIGVSKEDVSKAAKQLRNNAYIHPDKGEWGQDIEAKDLAAIVALRKAISKHGVRHAVSYHNSIKRARTFKDINEDYNQAFPGEGVVSGFHVSGSFSTGERSGVLNEFKESAFGLVTNARCLTEGVDVPNIDCVVFVDPRNSKIDIVQAAGRAMRPAPGKTCAYIIVPVLVEDADTSAFRGVLTMLSALASNDSRIIEYFEAILEGAEHYIASEEEEGEETTGEAPAEESLVDIDDIKDLVEIDVGECISNVIDVNKFKEEIELQCYERVERLAPKDPNDVANLGCGGGNQINVTIPDSVVAGFFDQLQKAGITKIEV